MKKRKIKRNQYNDRFTVFDAVLFCVVLALFVVLQLQGQLPLR